MAVLYDSTNADGIPADATLVAGYVDGQWPSYPAMVARFPNATHVSITVTAKDDKGKYVEARVLDVENGDATPIDAPGWAQAMRRAGINPTVYCSRLSAWPQVQIAFKDAFVAPPDYWIADYTNYAHLVQGSVATQWHDFGMYDQSETNGIWPGTAPPPQPQKGLDMITRDSKSGGYWVARANGDVYTYDGAPYLGPLPKYLAQWGIGTAAKPVTGITSDGAGGFTLAADDGGAQPNIYHITADGQYSR